MTDVIDQPIEEDVPPVEAPRPEPDPDDDRIGSGSIADEPEE